MIDLVAVAVAPLGHLSNVDRELLDLHALRRTLPHDALEGANEVLVALRDPCLRHGCKLCPRLGRVPSNTHHAHRIAACVDGLRVAHGAADASNLRRSRRRRFLSRSARSMSPKLGPLTSFGTRSSPRRLLSRNEVEASAQSSALFTGTPFTMRASCNSAATVTAASLLTSPSLTSGHWSSPPSSATHALTTSRNR